VTSLGEGDYVPLGAISLGEKGTKFPWGERDDDVPLRNKFPNA